MPVEVRAYLSPTLVLLAFDWAEGNERPDFLGFAIRRTPGFWAHDGKSRASSSWLPNRLTFDGPVPKGHPDVDSCEAPIQKFMWWDNRIDPPDRNQQFAYEVFPVVGVPDSPQLLHEEMKQCDAVLPLHVENGVGTWFNRAVLGSQGFSRKLAAMGIDPTKRPPPDKDRELRAWLANDLEQAVPYALKDVSLVGGAIYHLKDKMWVIPALRKFLSPGHKVAIVYDSHPVKEKGKPPSSPNQDVVDELSSRVQFFPRHKTHIMHDKVLISGNGPGPSRVLMGSANLTTEGLTQQANVLHTFDSPTLAQLYNAQMAAIASDPSIGDTAKLSKGWSPSIAINADTRVRAIFSPEPKNRRTQLTTIIDAINNASDSLIFCMFSPTDQRLIEACFTAADRGVAMFGLVNRISKGVEDSIAKTKAKGKKPTRTQLSALELYHRSRDNMDVVDGEHFTRNVVPKGFEPELLLYPGDEYPPYPPVIIHHKLLVIDAEGKHPIVYTGSANMSENSEHYNDENLLEIKSAKVAAIYLAEGLRLYEHYRARAISIDATKRPARREVLKLRPTKDEWATKYYRPGSPEYKARQALAGSKST